MLTTLEFSVSCNCSSTLYCIDWFVLPDSSNGSGCEDESCDDWSYIPHRKSLDLHKQRSTYTLLASLTLVRHCSMLFRRPIGRL